MQSPFSSVALNAFSVMAVFAFTSPIFGEVIPSKEIQSLAISPATINLIGSDSSAQVQVTALLKDGRQVDVTSDAVYRVEDGKTASLTINGRAFPRANGKSEVVAALGDQTARVPLIVSRMGENLPVNFTNQIVPIFTKLGCNAGGCHGKLAGQNGFRLSLLGFEPELDFMTLVKEGRGRRLFPAQPDASLLLQKATGRTAHGGGRKLEPDSDEYKLIRRWVATGMPWGDVKDPVVTSISISPAQRVMAREGKQQLAVYAHYSDNSIEDITRRAQYESNSPDTAGVDGEGLVRTLKLSGEAAIMARYQGRVAVARMTVPMGVKPPEWSFAANNPIDKATSKKWKELGLAPSEPCTDEIYVRRVYLDITGTLPTPAQVEEFIKNAKPNKRAELVNELLESPAYAFYFANKWADVLRVKRRSEAFRAAGTFAFHEWIRQQIAADKPYDQFAREILTANGDERRNPPTVWYKELEKPEQFVDDVSQVFLGQRLACANCHHHPYEKWGQDDYWGMAAFFGRVGRKELRPPTRDPNRNDYRVQVIYTRPNGNVVNKRTGKNAEMQPLDGQASVGETAEDPRVKLVEWMTDVKNPFFAKTIANRYWAHFFGRGVVEPLDDMRVTNPPSNPELLDALTAEVIEKKYSLKGLIRTICASKTYQLSSMPNEFNKDDRQSFARHYPKRLTAEVLYDAVCQVTASPAQFAGLPRDQHAPSRAIMLPDESFQSYFLDVFGRPQRISACECERVSEANLAQALHLFNSDEVQGKIARQGGRAELMAKDPKPDAEKIDELFLWAFGHKPTAEVKKQALDHIAKMTAKGPVGKKTAYEDLLWALLNTKEFSFNQ